MKREVRQSGRTTKQMLEALPGSVFIWCNAYRAYPRQLASSLGRGDLIIETPEALDAQAIRLCGHVVHDLIIDHACVLTEEQKSGADWIRSMTQRARAERAIEQHARQLTSSSEAGKSV